MSSGSGSGAGESISEPSAAPRSAGAAALAAERSSCLVSVACTLLLTQNGIAQFSYSKEATYRDCCASGTPAVESILGRTCPGGCSSSGCVTGGGCGHSIESSRVSS